VAQGGGRDVVIDIGEAYDRIGAHARPLPGETVPLADGAGRVLSADVLGAVDLPGFDRSSMDGWAVRSQDFASPPVSLPVRGDVAAGSAGDVPLEAGTAVVISTGAPMPPGSDAVLPLEDGEQADGVLTSSQRVRAKAFVRFRGEDVRTGDLLVPAGARLTPARLSVVASGGVAAVEVHRRPRVSVVATGSELVPLGEPLPPGAIYNSNGPTLTAFARSSGAAVLPPRSVADDPGSTRDVLGAALDEADVVLVSGGVSVGGHDLVKETLADLGVDELFWRVRIKPGKPIFCGRRGDTWVFGLPGNPVSTVAGFIVFVAPLLRRMQGERFAPPATSQVVLAADAPNPGERTTYATAQVTDRGVELTGKQGSHMTKALADADGFAILPWDRDVVPAGELVEFLPLG
jgi:molybdopterin molybdotransferase